MKKVDSKSHKETLEEEVKRLRKENAKLKSQKAAKEAKLKETRKELKKKGSSDISRDSLLKKKTAAQIVYLNKHKQTYNYEQQFSISCVGSIHPPMYS
ncbi:hypothetical protein [Bacteroides caecigallinarum]|uniref:hypothetical protein n=1 Tax=Bacteroides caecigallinarum TaxID=1411144 RepID=UPI001F2B4C6B|nr:hypothetical protein [Bacteroides caecigallinarum]MCF2580767.1 hypothetical protein [Bacteroides caecigallinarum]